MKVLFIAADYTGVHQNLHIHLMENNVSTLVYIPLNYELRSRFREMYSTPKTKFIYSAVLNQYDKFFYKKRIKKITNYLEKCDIEWSEISVIHATTLCIEGAIAYELSKKKGIPYIVAVRNTDINFYCKYFFLYKKYYRYILYNASKIILVSPVYKEYILNYISKENRIEINNKLQFIPNGINAIFLHNRNIKKLAVTKRLNVIYVGAICQNKNIINVAKALKLLVNNGIDVEYNIIGKGKADQRKYLSMLERYTSNNSWIKIKEKCSSEELLKYYETADLFIMCSFHETFGLVYAEAISQGLPIIYTKGEGFDGVFEEGEVGFAANPNDINDIVKKIKKVLDNYEHLIKNIQNVRLDNFDWKNIAEEYIKIYKKVSSYVS